MNPGGPSTPQRMFPISQMGQTPNSQQVPPPGSVQNSAIRPAAIPNQNAAFMNNVKNLNLNKIKNIYIFFFKLILEKFFSSNESDNTASNSHADSTNATTNSKYLKCKRATASLGSSKFKQKTQCYYKSSYSGRFAWLFSISSGCYAKSTNRCHVQNSK